MKPSLALMLAVTLTTTVAYAAPKVRIEPRTVRPGDAVLVTVTGTTEAPQATADGKKLEFFRAKRGYQALFAVPLVTDNEELVIHVGGVKKDITLAIKPTKFPETDVIVEEELANPGAADRKTIDTDNAAMIAALTKDVGDPQFTKAFRRPRGGVTSPFGEWRKFNDGFRSQHLGFDLSAKEGASVKAANNGTVTFVGDTLLAGKVVVISHGGGIATAYFHLNEAKVAQGDTVASGAEIGLAGKTGRTTGPHLHLGVRVPGGFVNPDSFFKLAITPAAGAAARRTAR